MDAKQIKITPELEDLSNQIGEFMEYWGFKKVHGQIWCHLFLSSTPLDASELMSRLAISKALVSISLKELLKYGVIFEVGKSPRGTRCYKATEDIMTPILETLRRREQRMISRVMGAHSLLSRLDSSDFEEMGIERKRLDYLGQVIRLADLSLENIIKKKWVGIADLLLMRHRLRGKSQNASSEHSSS
ncbi:GbsR/MarR family transcriptional regulator [Pseudobacteriovorax antillogorgiicola]|uniref:Winged helix DNA-binding domain-containing protein n=1 Tax=Pseudobacteriovorax antillogorgiicola TaxID=1513793 RepID=A0A1Y6B5M5_9BACT|nr:winged helix DNA-binding protein [Pseudobacteriovorax antillogorgiicola]TCS58893.1 winged helix DNA-binding protein [Pseudobacteriovorax antillogorgiicola]SME93517.1 Winged helix DNA-binding domain-containing protein [Pseudobacteriovorax antillogorgiicola]